VLVDETPLLPFIMSSDRDLLLRDAAMQKLRCLVEAGGGVVTADLLDRGFEFEGERIALWSSRRGIWRPKQLQYPGAALTIVTAPRVQGRAPAYDDQVAADDRGDFGYKYEGTDPNTWTNRAVRTAGELNRPLIYLYGHVPGVYEAIFPVYVTADDPTSLTFTLQADIPYSALQPRLQPSGQLEARREYQTVAVKRRLHQHRFRELVLGAYSRRCTMCHLGHVQLLDAAHIIPDHDDRGLPEIPNGLALCKIHHSAYDSNILGIAPDYRIHVRDDILREIDGPMLEHGLKGMADRKITVPQAVRLRPNKDFLDERFSRFVAA
jgi:putative restriction endonuclease